MDTQNVNITAVLICSSAGMTAKTSAKIFDSLIAVQSFSLTWLCCVAFYAIYKTNRDVKRHADKSIFLWSAAHRCLGEGLDFPF